MQDSTAKRVDEAADEQRATVCEERISHVGEGLISLDALLPELRSAGSLRTLCLHGNQLTQLYGLHHLPQLTELNLSSNNLTTLQDSLGTLTNLRHAPNPSVTRQALNGPEWAPFKLSREHVCCHLTHQSFQTGAWQLVPPLVSQRTP